MLKKELINDIFNIVMPNDWLKNKHKVGADTCKDTRVCFLFLTSFRLGNLYFCMMRARRGITSQILI